MSDHAPHHGHGHGHHEITEPLERWTAHFWDERYASGPALWSGHVNAVVKAEVADLPPGRALDIGCGEGGDALWLAGRGWRVVGVDVSQVALDRAAARAGELGPGIADLLTWEQHDVLSWAPPEGAFDLVSLSFLHLPTRNRTPAYDAMARAVAPGGTLLVVAHHPSDIGVVPRPPEPDLFFTAEELAADLGEGWDIVTSEARSRPGTHPDGHEVTLHDTVLRARRQ
jgi:SAM-dependent methyltransferase